MIILLLVLLLIIMRGKDLSVARFANFLELVLGVYCTFHTIKYNLYVGFHGLVARLCFDDILAFHDLY